MSSDGGSAPLLAARGVRLAFGGLTVLRDVDLTVRSGTIHGLLGPNGAGKTSLFNCISGLYRPEAGTIELSGDDLLSRPPHELAGLGVSRTFQHPTLDQDLTVLENVMVGAQSRMAGGFLSSALRLPHVRRDEREARDRAMDVLGWVGLSDWSDRRPGALPYGSQKLVELARAVVSEPKLLLLDEPAGGLAHHEVDELAERIRGLRDERGITVLLVEHHLGFVGEITDMVDILVDGRNIITAPAAEAQRDPEVVRAYLGQAA
ncbi:MAG: ABC transporter ATP-binding protein [Microbacterium sp.]